MSNGTESALMKWDGQRRGSHAVHEPIYGPSDESAASEDVWRTARVQSSAVSPSGLAWGLAILGALGTESESLTPVHVLGMAVPQYVSSTSPAPTQRATGAIALLDEWLEDDSGYDEQTWPTLKEALNRDRLSARKLFHG